MEPQSKIPTFGVTFWWYLMACLHEGAWVSVEIRPRVALNRSLVLRSSIIPVASAGGFELRLLQGKQGF